jgi:3-oxoacyl-[acyl-carrier protein] reductase
MTSLKSVAIVTGASQVIGPATALRLARDFPAVVIVSRDKNKLEEAASDVRSAGADAMIFDRDLPQPQPAEIIIKANRAGFGRIDGCSTSRVQSRRSTCSR